MGSRRERTLAVVAAWLRAGPVQLWLAVGFYLALDLVYFGAPALAHFGRQCVCGGGGTGDPYTYMWFLAWWPHALLGGHDPFVTNALFAPDRISLGAIDVVPGPALLLAPVTLLLGPLITYNLVALAAPVLAATAAFSLCRYVTRKPAAAVVGGYIFGFSPYMLGHLQGHLDLILVFPIPIAVLIALRAVRGEISDRRFLVLMTILFAFFFLCSQELTATLVIMGTASLALGYAFAPGARSGIRHAVRLALIAGAVAALIDGAFIYAALSGEVLQSFFNRYSDTVVADILGFFVPTDVIGIGHGWFGSVSHRFVGGTPENGVYVGIPLALAVLYYCARRWREPATRVLTVLLVLVIVVSLGSHLHVGGDARFQLGTHHTIPLPWYGVSRLGFLREVAPARFGVYLFLIVALIVALALAQAAGRKALVGTWSLAALGILALVPNTGADAWSSTPANPRLFTTDRYQRVIAPGETVLALPFADHGDSMLWQAETGFHFRLAEGYVGALVPADYSASLQTVPEANPTLAPDPAAVRAYLAARHVGVVVLDPMAASPWAAVLTALGLRAERVGGALVYPVT